MPLAPRPSAILWAVLFVACVASALEIPCRGIDPDELEHLHAAYSVYRGDVPYRDFFEHHGPALYYLLQPLFWVFGPELTVLWWGRAAMALCSLAALALTGLLARNVIGRGAALPVMCLLAWTTIFHSKAIELRPDVPAMLLVVIAAYLTLRAGPCRPGLLETNTEDPADTARLSRRTLLFIGLIGGAATLFTQKSIVPIVALAIAVGVKEARLFDKAGLLKTLVRAPCLIGLGGALAWGIAISLFALAGAVDDLLYSTVYQLWIWPLHSDRWEHLRPTLAADLTVWFAAGMEVLLVARSWRDANTWQTQRGAITLIAALCAVSLLWAKATYAQYYLLWLPFVVIVAVRRLMVWAEGGLVDVLGRDSIFVHYVFPAWMLLIFLEVALLNSAAIRGLQIRFELAAFLCVPIAFGVALWRGERTWIIALLSAIGMFYGVLRNVNQRYWSNADQVIAITDVNQQVRPDETILDGFTGYAALRPHAYYYWWINAYSLALMSPEDRESRLLEHLEQHPPAGVLWDRDLKLMPESVQEWVREHYRPANPVPLWLRRERPSVFVPVPRRPGPLLP